MKNGDKRLAARLAMSQFDNNRRAISNAIDTQYDRNLGGISRVDDRISSSLYDESMSTALDEPVVDNKNEESKSWYESLADSATDVVTGIKNTLFGDVNHLDLWKQDVDLSDVYNNAMHKLIQDRVEKVEGSLVLSKQNREDLSEINTYLNNVGKLKDTLSQTGGQIVTDEQKNLYNDILKFEEKAKTDGKKSDAIRKILFDTNKASAWDNIKAFWNNSFGYKYNADFSKIEKNPTNMLNWLDYVSQHIEGFTEGLRLIGITSVDLFDSILPETILGQKISQQAGNNIRRDILRVDVNDRLYDKLFVDHGELMKDSAKFSKLQNKTNRWLNDAERDKKEKESTLKSQQNTFKNGSWFYDPNSIDPEYKKLQETSRLGIIGAFLHPAYSIPELGTSYSDIEDFMFSMATDKAASVAATKLASFAMRNNPLGTALTIAEIAKGIRSSNKLEKAVALGSAASKAETAIKWATPASQLYFTSRMREQESMIEANGAYTSRTLNEAMNKGVNLKQVFDEVDARCDAAGIERGSTELEKMSLALALDVYGNKEFNEIAKEARKGLNKVYNDNNTLAFMDYAEQLPFLNFSRSAIRDFGRLLSDWNSIRKGDKFEQGFNRLKRERLAEVEKSIQGVVDRLIQKAADKLFSKAGNKVAAYHGAQYVKRKLGQALPLMTKEGIEEGQQHLLQQEYQRGEYDDYTDDTTMFNLPSLIRNQNIAAQAVGDYLGINFGSADNGDEELRRAMEIGAVTSLFFGAPHILTNFSRSKDPEKRDDNVRNLIHQMKNDKILNRIVTENYGKAQDDAHVGMYFDFMATGKSDIDEINRAFNDFKKFKGENVTDEYIDYDKKLFNTAAYAYHSPILRDLMQKQFNVEGGATHSQIKEGSEEHKALVKLATQALLDNETAVEAVDKSVKLIEQLKSNVLNQIDNNNLESNPILKGMVDKIRSQYSAHLKHADAALVEELGEDSINFTKEQWDSKVKEKAGTEDEYVKRKIENIFAIRELENARKIKTQLEDQLTRQQLVSEETGTDIDTSRLGYMIDFINDFIKERELAYRNNRLNKIIMKHNEEHPDDQKQEITTEDLYKQYGLFENQDDIDKAQQALIMNSALHANTEPIATMYYTGSIDPETAAKLAHKISWDSISDMLKTLFMNARDIDKSNIEEAKKAWDAAQDVRLSELEKLANQHKLTKNTDEQELGLEEATNILYGQLAARSIIDEHIATKLERQKIAHKEWLKEQAPSAKDVEKAEEGDKEAIEKVSGSESIDDAEDVQDLSDELADVLTSNDFTSADQILDEEAVKEKKRQKDIQSKTKKEKELAIIDDDDSVDQDDIDTHPSEAAEDDTFESSEESMNDLEDSGNMDTGEDAQDISSLLEETSDKVEEEIVLDENEFIIEDPNIIEQLENEDYPHLSYSTSEKSPYATEDLIASMDLCKIVPNKSKILFSWNFDGDIKYTIVYQDENSIDGITIWNISAIQIRKVGNKYVAKYDTTNEDVDSKDPGYEGFLIPEQYQEIETNTDEGYATTIIINDNDPSTIIVAYDYEYNMYGPTNKYSIYKQQGVDQPSSDTETPVSPDAGVDKNTGMSSADSASSSVGDNESHPDDKKDNEEQKDETKRENDEIQPEVDDSPVNDGDDPIDKENEKQDRILESGSMNDPEDLDEENASLDDYELEGENETLDSADDGDFDQNDQFEGVRQFAIRTSEQAKRDYLGSTCFYQPDSTTPVTLSVNGKPLKTRYQIQPGIELSLKLLDHNWLKSCKTYYVVSGNQKKMTGEDDKKNPDCLTVALIIDDEKEKKTYVTFYRTPGQYSWTNEEGKQVWTPSGESALRAEMRLYGMTEEYKEDPNNEDWRRAVGESVSLRYAESQHKQLPRRSRYSTEEEYNAARKAFDDAAYSWYTHLKADNPLKRRVDDALRTDESLGFRQKGKTPLTHMEIDTAIQKLKDQRNAIINEYCTRDEDGNIIIPEEIKTTVVPEVVNQSHGRFNNQTDDYGNHQFRSLIDGGFDLDEDIESLSNQITNGDVYFGVGHGRQPMSPVQYPGVITDVMSAGEAAYVPGAIDRVIGKTKEGDDIIMNGLSGKIYAYVVTGYDQHGNPMRTPVMLSEQRFNKQDGDFIHRGTKTNPGNLKLAINADGSFKEGVKPSVAEVILMSALGIEVEDEAYKLLFNTGTNNTSGFFDLVIHKTKNVLKYLKHQNVINKYWYMTDKVFKFENGMLYIGERDGDTHKIGLYKKEDILNDEELRKNIIYTISENMHWNTPVRQNQERGEGKKAIHSDTVMADNMPDDIIEAIKRYFDNHPGEKTFSICGCEELTFNYDDFFYEDTSSWEIVDYATNEKRHPVKTKNINLLAWMLKNKKLVTDLGEQPFVDPFVFASGVKNTPVERKLERVKKESKKVDDKKPATSTLDASALEKAALDALAEEGLDDYIKGITSKIEWFEKTYKPKLIKERTAQARKQMQDEYQAVFGSPMSDFLILDIPEDSKDVQKDILDKVDQYINWTSSNTSEDVVKVTTVNYLNAVRSLKKVNKQHMVYLRVDKDGTAIVGTASGSLLLGRNVYAPFVTGVYETTKTKGQLDHVAAKEWLTKVLGIPVGNVAVVASMKTASGEKAYGVTRMFTRTIGDVVEKYPTITLSMEAGSGVHYHEAWHYVNLLLHSKQLRLKAYQDYVKSHPELKDSKLKEIEEAMADDFREYMEFNMDNSLSGRVKRLFKNILDFINIWKKPDVTKQLFNDIRRGKYVKSNLDDASVKEFTKRYPEGVYKADMYIPTVNSELLENINSISSYSEFYSVGVNIAHALMSQCDIRTIDDLKGAAAKFEGFIEDLKTLSKNDDLAMDVLRNIDAFKQIIIGEFEQLGIDCKFKENKLKVTEKTNQKELDHSATDRENRKDFTYDIMDLSVSKKDNVMFRAKLFLKQIPLYRWDEEHEAEAVTNPILKNIQEYWSFNEAWNKVLSNLWNCESYADTDENGYKATSIRGMVERLSKTDPFFYALNEKLEEIEGDVLLETQIFCTVKSSKPQIAYTRLEDPKRSFYLEDDIDEDTPDANAPVADLKRIITILDDNAVSVVRSLQREWSKTLMLTPVIKYNAQTGVVTVDDKYFEENIRTPFKKLLKSINISGKTIKRFVTKDRDALNEICSNAEQELIKVLQLLGIPADTNVIDTLIANRLDDPKAVSDPTTKLIALQDLLASDERGSISQIIKDFRSAGKNSKSQIGKKEIDAVYTGQKETSQISQLAKAYNQLYPQSSEFSVQAPDGSTIYPISQNNFMSDRIRMMNNSNGNIVKNLRKSPYALNSLLLKMADELHKNSEILTGEDRFILDAFVGMLDTRTREGNDYMAISPMDDYISKLAMTRDDLIVLPTMADKKTWYAIKSRVRLVHDVITNGDINDHQALRFSENTLDIFSGYMIDEFNSLMLYYNRDNLLYLCDNPLDSYKNFHGKQLQGKKLFIHLIKSLPVGKQKKFASKFGFFDKNKNPDVDSFVNALSKDKNLYEKVLKSVPKGVKDYIASPKMTWGGNGGMFRYMYDVLTFKMKQPVYDGEGNISGHNLVEINMNLYLEYSYKKQILLMFDPASGNGYQSLREGSKEFDGFEAVRKALLLIRDGNITVKDGKRVRTNTAYFKKTNTGYVPTEELRTKINEKLIRLSLQELYRLSSDPNIKLVSVNPDGKTFNNIAIPDHIRKETESAMKEKLNITSAPIQSDVVLTIIANHVVSTAISIIELEKVFAGDPAYYKTANQREEISITSIGKDNKPDEEDNIISITQIRQKADDKIKRLGALLSPGANLRLSYDEQTILDHPDPVTGKYTLRGSKYTNLNITDTIAKSQFLDTIRIAFGRLLYVDYMRQHKEELEIVMANYGFKREEAFYNELYLHEDKYKEVLESSSALVLEYVEKGVKQQSSPYDGITVADAQVCIRPALYRKIRISLGQWSFEEDETGYSDEKAYEILETDGSWMTDPEKAAIVSKLQLFPLKMTYFTNDNVTVYETTGHTQNLPIYNKMAIFPMFKYATLSGTGMQLYERMNRPGLEIDMVTFESAVKVGLNQHTHTPYEEGVTDMNEFDNSFDLPSDWYLDDNGEPVKGDTSVPHLAILVQDLDGLRLQLNTEAHTDEERAIGTQMFKIAFSNIIDDALYGLNQGDGKCRTGTQLKREIMSCINAMTHQGIRRVMRDYGTEAKIHGKMRKICKSNGVGVSAEALLEDGAKVASLVTRKVFEQGVSSAVNRDVVDINTKGGSAIQQSVFGFVGYKKKDVRTFDEDALHKKWLFNTNISDLGLSVRTTNLLKAYDVKTLKDVIDKHDEYIKARIYGKKIKSELEDLLESFNLDWDTVTDIAGNTVQTEDLKYHVLNEGKELKWYKNNGTMEIMLSMNFFKQVLPEELKNAPYAAQREWLIEHDIIQGTKKDGTKSKPKPFGVGYRIPTQGMSSMFVFTVADVLPNNSGDNIIVPREFTALTGSDFDVDKLFLATTSYRNGELELLTDIPENLDDMDSIERLEYFKKQSTGAVSNRLLQDYMTIIADVRNLANARASIDTITEEIKKNILPLVKEAQVGYLEGMSELLPSFLSRKKMEFSVGKTGIGPFALNITNLALTQYTHLTMDFSNVKEFKLGALDLILGEDGNRISDWLSALVNAHVDVAKDPYVFDINVNSCTYNMANLLLRCGKGRKTFMLLAQPALKQYANKVNSMNGMYGQNLTKAAKDSNEYENKAEKIRAEYEKGTKNALVAKLKEVEALAKEGDENAKRELDIFKKRVTLIIKDKGGKPKWEDAFDEKLLEKALTNPNSLCAAYMNLLALKSFKRLSPYAKELSQLVKYSKIDTKKFGNNIASHINWRNSYEQFKFGKHLVRWYINDGKYDPKSKENPTAKALLKYFHNMFLDDKFYSATRLTRQILRKEVMTATTLFNDIFQIVMSEIHGTKIVTLPNGLMIPYYDSVSDDDHVLAIADAIDTMMRFAAIKNSEVVTVEDSEYDSYSGPIDFTYGGDMNAVQQKMHDLIFGNETEGSIIDRISIFMHELRSQHTENEDLDIDEISEGLLSRDGVGIANDFLLFLSPRPADDKFPIGRLMLLKPRGYVDPYIQKGKLISGFDQLLRHPSEHVRRLARDIAFYAYYSTYDTNSGNSFFELVPPYYRKQIDINIKSALNGASDRELDNNDDGGSDSNVTLDSMLGISSNGSTKLINFEFLDTLFRNYYYDDRIVGRYYIEKISDDEYDDDVDDEKAEARRAKRDKYYQIKTIKINGKRGRFPGIIETNSANATYIKTTINGITQIYKKVGVSYEEQTKEKKDGTTETKRINEKSVYVIVSKLGVHKGNNHQYEFIGGNGVPSIYEENSLPIEMSTQVLSQVYKQKVLDKGKRKFEQTNVIDIESRYVQNVSSVRRSRQNNTNQQQNVRFVKVDARFTDPGQYCTKEADVSFEVDMSKSVDQNVKSLTKLLNSDIPQSLHLSGTVSGKVTKSEVSKFINEQVQQFKQRLLNNRGHDEITQDELEKEVKEYKELLELVAQNMLIQQKANKFIADMYIKLLMSGYTLSTVYSTGESGIEEASIKAFMALDDKFTRPNAYVVCDKKLKNDKFDLFAETFNIDSEIMISQEELDMIDSVNDALIYMNDQTSDDVEREEWKKGSALSDEDFEDADDVQDLTEQLLGEDGSVQITDDILLENVDDEDFDDLDMNSCDSKIKK